MLAADGPNQQLINLFHQGTRLTFSKGDFIIPPGSSPTGVFYIVSGLIKAYDITRYGEENLLIIRKGGEVIGLTWAITERERDIMYAALAPTTVLRLDREIFRDHIQSHPEAALPLVDMIMEMYRLHSERILNLEYRSVRERLVSFLLTTSNRFGRETEDGLLIDVPLRHQDIASSISATRETTSRELAVLERAGLLRNHQSFITLLNLEKLRRYLA